MNQPDIIVSNNLKSLREQHNLSYTQLAQLTGVSKSMLRQIEIGDSSPTIQTLWKIANGLQIPFTSLLNPPEPEITKANFTQNSPLTGQSEGYRLFPLVPFDITRNYEVYYVEIEPDTRLDADPHTGHAEEVILVTQGQLNMRVLTESIQVNAGEFLKFDATNPHQYENNGNELIKAFMIISYRHA